MGNGKISNLNISGEKNDMIDKIEEYIDDIIFSDDLKSLIKSEITKLRIEVKNKDINWTQNEQDELKKLLKNVAESNEIKEKDKINFLINIMDQKINNELKELEKIDLKPEQIIELIKKDKKFNKNIKITDEYIGNSKYLTIIFPIKHRKENQKNIDDIDEEYLLKLLKQNYNFNFTIDELIKKGINITYSFEGFDMKELSENLYGGMLKEDIKLLNEYEKLLKDKQNNKKRIREIEKKIIFYGIDLIYPEYKHKDKLLSYGLNIGDNYQIIIDIGNLIELITNEGENNALKIINNFINNTYNERLKNGYSKDELDIYIKRLKNFLIFDNFNKLSFNQYCIELYKKYLYLKIKEPNENVLKNIEILNENSNPNAIIILYGEMHFKNLDKIGIEEIDNMEIENIKEGLKRKGISFIEVTPFTEKK